MKPTSVQRNDRLRMLEQVSQIFLCPNCLSPGEAAGACVNCGTEVLTCRPGDPDDPCRRPLINAEGKVLTRAPLWWLQHKVRPLVEQLDLL